MILTLLLPLTGLSGTTRLGLAWFVLTGVILQFSGVLAAWYFNFDAIYIADLGAAVLIAGVAMVLYGLLKPGNRASDLGSYIASRFSTRSSRLLMKAGLLLLLICMLLGMYLAWLIVSGAEANSLAAVSLSVEHLMQEDIEKAKAAISTFKFTQAKSAINAASHSHGLVMGIFMLLLAMLHPMIKLKENVFRKMSLVGETMAACAYS